MPNNGILGASLLLIVVQVLRKYMTIGHLDPSGSASHKSLERGYLQVPFAEFIQVLWFRIWRLRAKGWMRLRV